MEERRRASSPYVKSGITKMFHICGCQPLDLCHWGHVGQHLVWSSLSFWWSSHFSFTVSLLVPFSERMMLWYVPAFDCSSLASYMALTSTCTAEMMDACSSGVNTRSIWEHQGWGVIQSICFPGRISLTTCHFMSVWSFSLRHWCHQGQLGTWWEVVVVSCSSNRTAVVWAFSSRISSITTIWIGLKIYFYYFCYTKSLFRRS